MPTCYCCVASLCDRHLDLLQKSARVHTRAPRPYKSQHVFIHALHVHTKVEVDRRNPVAVHIMSLTILRTCNTEHVGRGKFLFSRGGLVFSILLHSMHSSHPFAFRVLADNSEGNLSPFLQIVTINSIHSVDRIRISLQQLVTTSASCSCSTAPSARSASTASPTSAATQL